MAACLGDLASFLNIEPSQARFDLVSRPILRLTYNFYFTWCGESNHVYLPVSGFLDVSGG